MGWMEWTAQLAVAALLAGTIPVALRLERALRTVRRDHDTLIGCATALDGATRGAEAASQRLRHDSDECRKDLEAALIAAEPLRDDLRYLLQRAEQLADRLDEVVRAARGAVPTPTVAHAAAPKPVESRAERDLMLALARRAA